MTGNVSRAFQTVAADLPGGWTENPYLNRGLRVTQNVLDGDYVGALESTDLVNLGALRNWFAE